MSRMVGRGRGRGRGGGRGRRRGNGEDWDGDDNEGERFDGGDGEHDYDHDDRRGNDDEGARFGGRHRRDEEEEEEEDGGGHGRRPGGYGNVNADGPVDVGLWTMWNRLIDGDEPQPTPYLVGPIVGTVTDTTARILLEVDGEHEVTMQAFMDGRKVYEHTQTLKRKCPTVFKLHGFEENKRIMVKVNVGNSGQEREARFTTISNKTNWKIATVSCNCHSRMEQINLWERLSRVIGDVDCVLHMGDQVYADMDRVSKRDPSKSFHSAWVASNEFLTDLEDEEQWEEHRHQILEQYRRTYRETWNYPELAQVLASCANYMICDDHEIVDDLGDKESHIDHSSKEFYVIKLGYQVYLEYQKQLLCDTDALDMTNKVYYHIKLSPKVAFVMSDNRVERSVHRADGREEDWEHKTLMGPDQWEYLSQTFSEDLASCDVVLFVSPTPIVFLSQRATGLATQFMDDAKGTWGHGDFETEQSALCEMLSAWQNEEPNRAVVTLGGDVHIGGFTDSWHAESNVPLHQMTASAIGNTPEGNINDLKATIMRTAMSGDERLFEFKVDHHEWVYGPNFGMIDLTVGKRGERPDVTMTLVPGEGDVIVRNLSFGDDSIEVDNATLNRAAKKAHATAKELE